VSARQVFYQPFFVFVIFVIGSLFMPGPTWAVILLFVLLLIAGITGANHNTSHCLRWCLENFLPRLALNHNPPNLWNS
jgi:hypothetical protein